VSDDPEPAACLPAADLGGAEGPGGGGEMDPTADSPLAVFTDGDYEWWVATDRTAWLTAYMAATGEAEADLEHWRRMGDDEELRIWLNMDAGDIAEPGDERATIVIGPAAVWAEAFGEGFLCGTES
jgi:hypothetical protein